MRSVAALGMFVVVAGLAVPASADVLSLGTSNESIGLVGIGADPQGRGQSRVTFGNCSFDGTNTNCKVTGTYTGLGAGTYSQQFSYPGNGASPLLAVSQTPGADLIFFSLTGAGSFVMKLTPASGPPVSFYDLTYFFQFASQTCTNIATSSCLVGQVGLTVGATLTGPAKATFDTTPFIKPSGLVSASAFGGFSSVAPGSWMEIYGTNLATTLGQVWGGADFNGNQAPTALGGTKVTVGGKPAYVDYVSPQQVNAQVPSGVPVGSQPVVVTTAGGSSANYFVTVNAVQPGLLAPPVFKLAAGQYVVALFPDGRTYVLPPVTSSVPTARAKPGDVITLYGVGFGPVTPDNPAGLVEQAQNALVSPFTATIGGQPAAVAYAGLAPGYVGLYQFNVTVPQVPAGDAVPFTFSLGNSAGSQTGLIIAIGN